MYHIIRKTTALLSMIWGGLLAVQPASAHEIYAKAGFPGVGAGYAHNLNQYIGVRADFSSAGTVNLNGEAGKLHYDADMKADHLGAYADWFLFGGSFRLSGGLHSRTLELSIDGRPAQNGNITIGNVNIPYDSNTYTAQARVEWPKTAPYLGLGWGHHARRGAGFGFIADLGVSFGAPKTTLAINDALREDLDKLARFTGTNADIEIERQRHNIADDVETVKVFPHLFVGISYRF